MVINSWRNTANHVELSLCVSQGQALHPIDGMFLFLNYLALGLKQRDLADHNQIHQSAVARIILT